jgi:hypothetical protein
MSILSPRVGCDSLADRRRPVSASCSCRWAPSTRSAARQAGADPTSCPTARSRFLLNPEVASQDADGPQPSPTADTDAFKSFCEGKADSRFVDAVISIGSGIVLAVVRCSVGARERTELTALHGTL